MSNLKLNEQERAISELLAANGITFEVFVVGELVSVDNWQHDAYHVRFTKSGKTESFDFKQGIGHRSKVAAPKGEKVCRVAGKMAMKGSHFREFLILPTAASVIYSLLLDSQACGESFAAWCSIFGYEEDSRKALALYLECQSIGQRLGFLSGIRSQIETILQDY